MGDKEEKENARSRQFLNYFVVSLLNQEIHTCIYGGAMNRLIFIRQCQKDHNVRSKPEGR